MEDVRSGGRAGRSGGEPARQLVRTCLWRWLRGTGLERFDLLREGGGWLLRGTILALGDRRSAEAHYEVFCDSAWHTRRADIRLDEEGGERSLRLTVENGRWYEDGRKRDTVRGSLDLDLGWSPSTNTLPIRRLNLGVGESSGAVTAAWVRFPELTLEPLPQEYRRLSERRYRYTSRAGAFTAEIDVDDHGLVIDYGDVWQRVGEVR